MSIFVKRILVKLTGIAGQANQKSQVKPTVKRTKTLEI